MQLENTFTVPAGIEEAWEAFNDPRRVAPCFPGATLENYEGDSFTGTVKVKLGPISLTYKGKGTFVERDKDARKVVIDASGRDSRGNGTASATVTGTLSPDGDSKTTVKMVTDMTVTGRPAQFGRGVMADVSDKIVGQFASCLSNKLGSGDAAESSDSSGKPAAGAGSVSAAGASAASASSAAGTNSGTGSADKPKSGATATTKPAGTAANGETVADKPAGAGRLEDKPASPGAASSNGSGSSTASAPSSGPTRSEVDAIDLLDTAGAPVLKRLAPVVAGVLVLFVVLRLVKRKKH